MIRILSILFVCTILLGCATSPRQKVPIEDLTLQKLEMFVNRHSDELLASFGAPSRRHPAKHGVFWEYKRNQRFVVFLIRDKDQTVAGVNAGTDERKVYEKWDSVWDPELSIRKNDEN